MADTGTGANQVPPGGVPRSWIANTRSDIADLADRYADQYGVPRQFVYNIIFRENGTGSGTGNEGLRITRSSAGAEGPMQMIEGTRRAYGITASSPLEAQMEAGIHYLSDLGWNRPDPQGGATGRPGGQFSQFDPAAAAGGYIGSPAGYYNFVTNGSAPGFKNNSQAYVVHTTQGVVPMASLPQIFQNLPVTQQFRGSSAFPTFDEAGWIAEDPGISRAGLDFLTAWETSNPAAPTERLWAGPEGASVYGLPWQEGGVIPLEYGRALQYYGLMPSNLEFNAQTNTWNPTRAPLSDEGLWSAPAIQNWTQQSQADPSVQWLRDYGRYLRELGQPPAPEAAPEADPHAGMINLPGYGWVGLGYAAALIRLGPGITHFPGSGPYGPGNPGTVNDPPYVPPVPPPPPPIGEVPIAPGGLPVDSGPSGPAGGGGGGGGGGTGGGGPLEEIIVTPADTGMMAQPGASATGSIGGSHDSAAAMAAPASASPFFGEPPAPAPDMRDAVAQYLAYTQPPQGYGGQAGGQMPQGGFPGVDAGAMPPPTNIFDPSLQPGVSDNPVVDSGPQQPPPPDGGMGAVAQPPSGLPPGMDPMQWLLMYRGGAGMGVGIGV